jgi:hypothetical protein
MPDPAPANRTARIALLEHRGISMIPGLLIQLITRLEKAAQDLTSLGRVLGGVVALNGQVLRNVHC